MCTRHLKGKEIIRIFYGFRLEDIEALRIIHSFLLDEGISHTSTRLRGRLELNYRTSLSFLHFG